MVDKTLDQIAYKCDCRNTEEHTKDPGNTAADRDGEDDPQRLQTGRISEDFRSEDQTVKLL